MMTTMIPTSIAEMREVGHWSEALPNHRLQRTRSGGLRPPTQATEPQASSLENLSHSLAHRLS